MKTAIRLILFCIMMVLTTAIAFAEKEDMNANYRIAIIPYINSTEETKGYIEEIIDENYGQYFVKQGLEAVEPLKLQESLHDNGYDASNMELPDRDLMAAVAQATNADYVIAMEISQLATTRHMSFFQAKVVTKAKLRYKLYSASKNKALAFQVTGLSENKTVFGGVGFKNPITKALGQATDEANEKIMSSL